MPEEEAEAKKLELEQEYMEYGVDFMKFNPKELHDSFRFIHKLCKPKEYLDISTVEASMLVALLLRSRAKSILNEGTDLKNEDCSHSSEDMSIEKLIDNADKLVKYLYGFWNSPSSLKDSLLSKDSNVKVLNLAFEGADFKRMSPNDFYCTVIEPSDD